MSIAESVTLLSGVIATGAGSSVRAASSSKTFQASGATSAGAGAATILVQGSNDETNWDTLGTISLTLATTSSSDGFTSCDRYKFHRGNVSAISGTGAAVSMTEGF